LMGMAKLTAIPTIAPELRAVMHSAARSMSQIAAPPPPSERPEHPPRERHENAGGRPGDDFNARATWSEILGSQGWKVIGQRGDTALWQRPGKTGPGISATTGHCGDHLYVFSTNAQPFEAENTYSKFAAHAILNCSGYYAAAARDLNAKGYGERPAPKTSGPLSPPPEWLDEMDEADRASERQPGEDDGDVDPGATQQGQELPTPGPAQKKRKGLDIIRLNDRPPIPTRWVVGGLVPEESCLVMGAEEKTGKTWLLFELAIAVACGYKVLDTWAVHKKGTVLLYSPESGMESKRARLWGLCWGLGLDPRFALENLLFIRSRLDLTKSDCIKDLTAAVAEHKPVLLIIDPLIAAHIGMDENDAGEVQSVLNTIRDLGAASPGMSTIVAHHLGKQNKERSSFHGLRGSTAIGAWADGRITLRKETDEQDATRRVDIEHRDSRSPPPVGFRILEVPPPEDAPEGVSGYRLEPCEAPEPNRGGRPRTSGTEEEKAAIAEAKREAARKDKATQEQAEIKLIEDCVAKNDGIFDVATIARKIGVCRNRVGELVAFLEEDGHLIRKKRKVFLAVGQMGIGLS
jgi:hypothetical protein